MIPADGLGAISSEWFARVPSPQKGPQRENRTRQAEKAPRGRALVL